ncbi:zeta toxin family protein [Candidatus Saccharibacteria bacterium]|nr:zeta toxin family protein [Candidatus Saccharibacteria bacterium]
MSKQPILLIIKGYAGAGKSALAFEYAKQEDFALIKQDTFVFELNPGSMIERIGRPTDAKYSFQNILSVMENYMATKKSIILEGALVVVEKYNPLDFKPILQLAKKYGYQPILITLTAKERKRRRRQRKRGYRLPIELDRKLAKLADQPNIDLPNHIINTTKLNKKQVITATDKIVKTAQ